MRIEERRGQATATADQILGEIRDYCRATQTAESTFVRIVVNDGKLVSRLRDGARITTGTLDKVRAYLSEDRAPAPVAQVNGAVAPDSRRPGFASSTTGKNTCCSCRPAARRQRSATGSRWSSAT